MPGLYISFDEEFYTVTYGNKIQGSCKYLEQRPTSRRRTESTRRNLSISVLM